MNWLIGTLFLAVVFSAVGCVKEVPISLREHVFQGKPLWMSEALNASPASRALMPSVAASPKVIRVSEAPGLYSLVNQVLPDDHSLAPEARPAAMSPVLLPAAAPNGASIVVAYEAEPLPPELARLNATKAIVESLKAAYLQTDVPDTHLTSKDFQDLAEAAFRTSVATYQQPTPRLAKVLAFHQGIAMGNVPTRAITWQLLQTTYFTAYYKGKFVDRTGGTLSKPTLGMKISNDTITAALTVVLEATFDYATLQSHCAGSRLIINNPILFQPKDGKPCYCTKDNARPTLVDVLVTATTAPGAKVDFDAIPATITGILEPLQTDETMAGITQKKLDNILLLSGYASDAAGSLSDLITRTFGGIHIGFVVLGKVSVGDNDTLSKIVQTTADLTAKRTTEAAVATYLYPRTYTAPPAGASLQLSANTPDFADALGYNGGKQH